MSNVLVSVQIIPKASSTEEVIRLVDEAISIIYQTGMKYEVHPLETTMEGELETLLSVIAEMNKKMVEFLKIIASAVTGKRLAEGTEGSLDV